MDVKNGENGENVRGMINYYIPTTKPLVFPTVTSIFYYNYYKEIQYFIE